MDKEKLIADVDARLTRIVETMPADLAEQARTMTEVELLAETGSKMVQHLMVVLRLLAAALARCGVCRDSENTCAHCVATNMQVMEIANEALILATITKAATVPGSRIAAQREARDEAKAAEESKA